MAAKSIVAQFRRFKARLETVQTLLADKPNKEVSEFALRWMRNIAKNKTGTAAKILEEIDKEKDGNDIPEEEEHEEEKAGGAVVTPKHK